MDFKDARTIVELTGLLVVLMPMSVMGILALKWHYFRKGSKK